MENFLLKSVNLAKFLMIWDRKFMHCQPFSEPEQI